MIKVTVNVEGMMCPHCEAHVNDAVKKAFGVEDVVSSHENKTTIFTAPEKVDEEKVRQTIKDAGYEVYGGVNAPYIWLKTPDQMNSWEFFDYLLEKANVVGTPGSGFGPSGEGYFRLTAFGTYENTVKAIDRMKAL